MTRLVEVDAVTSWRTRDSLDREIASTETGRAHILQRRPAMSDRLDDVRRTIASPDPLTRDRTYDRRECFYRRTTSGRRWLKVVVSYRPTGPDGNWTGLVVTAYFLDCGPSEELP